MIPTSMTPPIDALLAWVLEIGGLLFLVGIGVTYLTNEYQKHRATLRKEDKKEA
jgi:hypothetical protein